MIDGLLVVRDAYNVAQARKHSRSSAVIARRRLEFCIGADRCRVPAYRWVRRTAGLDWMTALGLALGFPWLEGGAWLSRAFKPRYRLERRK